jgi:hypothetical protein
MLPLPLYEMDPTTSKAVTHMFSHFKIVQLFPKILSSHASNTALNCRQADNVFTCQYGSCM